MFMPINSKENWANGGTTEQTRNANERANEKPREQADSRTTEITIKRSTARSPVRTNERNQMNSLTTEWRALLFAAKSV